MVLGSTVLPSGIQFLKYNACFARNMTFFIRGCGFGQFFEEMAGAVQPLEFLNIGLDCKLEARAELTILKIKTCLDQTTQKD